MTFCRQRCSLCGRPGVRDWQLGEYTWQWSTWRQQLETDSGLRQVYHQRANHCAVRNQNRGCRLRWVRTSVVKLWLVYRLTRIGNNAKRDVVKFARALTPLALPNVNPNCPASAFCLSLSGASLVDVAVSTSSRHADQSNALPCCR